MVVRIAPDLARLSGDIGILKPVSTVIASDVKGGLEERIRRSIFELEWMLIAEIFEGIGHLWYFVCMEAQNIVHVSCCSEVLLVPPPPQGEQHRVFCAFVKHGASA